MQQQQHTAMAQIETIERRDYRRSCVHLWKERGTGQVGESWNEQQESRARARAATVTVSGSRQQIATMQAHTSLAKA
jgi:hypothetical protein